MVSLGPTIFHNSVISKLKPSEVTINTIQYSHASTKFLRVWYICLEDKGRNDKPATSLMRLSDHSDTGFGATKITPKIWFLGLRSQENDYWRPCIFQDLRCREYTNPRHMRTRDSLEATWIEQMTPGDSSRGESSLIYLAHLGHFSHFSPQGHPWMS